MSKTLTVACREFRQTVLRPIFIIAVLGIPVLIIGVMALAIFLTVQNKQPPMEGTVAVADLTGEVAEAARVEFDQQRLDRDQAEQLRQMQQQTMESLEGGAAQSPLGASSPPVMPAARGEIRIDIERVDGSNEEDVASLAGRVSDGDLVAAAVVTSEVIEAAEGERERSAPFTLYVGEDLDSDHVGLLERRIGQAVVRVRAERAGLDPDEALAMLRRPGANTSRTLEDGETAKEGEGRRVLQQLLPALFMILIWVSTFTSAQHLLMSTIEEKSNRVMEVLLSAVSPLQLMTGKILGHGAVGLLIAALYSSVVVIGFAIGAIYEESFRDVIVTSDLVLLAIFFFMAYFMIASLMAAVGSAVSDIREANTLVTPVMLMIMIPWILWMPISQSPKGALATVFSFIPPASPFAMIIRMAAEEEVPFWQYPVTIVWGYLCVIAMVWMAAKIFRVGVLMYGKPPSPLELIKWIRYS